MRLTGTLFSKAATLAAGRALASALAAAWLVVAARLLSLVGFGSITLALALTLILGTLSDFGLQAVLARDVVQHHQIRRAVFDRVVVRRIAAAALAIPVLVVLYALGTHTFDIVIPLVFGGSLLGTAIYSPSLVAYRARGKVGLEIGTELGARCLTLVVGVPWLLAGGQAISVAVTYAAISLGSAALVFAVVRRSSVAVDDRSPMPRLTVVATLPFIFSNAIGIVYQRIDQYMVGLLRGAAQAGLYGASYRWQDANLILPIALGQLGLSHEDATDSARYRLGRRLTLESVAAAVIPAIGIALFADKLMSGVFGGRYQGTGIIVAVLMAGTIPGAAVAALTPLTSISKPSIFAWASGISLAVNVGLNLALIPSYSGLGAAIANLISQTLLALALYQLLRGMDGARTDRLPSHAN